MYCPHKVCNSPYCGVNIFNSHLLKHHCSSSKSMLIWCSACCYYCGWIYVQLWLCTVYAQTTLSHLGLFFPLSSLGRLMFVGYIDHTIRAWDVLKVRIMRCIRVCLLTHPLIWSSMYGWTLSVDYQWFLATMVLVRLDTLSKLSMILAALVLEWLDKFSVIFEWMYDWILSVIRKHTLTGKDTPMSNGVAASS